ncbi:MAG: hypothetical protein KDB07_02700, partial [Planctomycetes bacterium]|nr:hypothetical protein [Planctomycetota bacterium]
SSRRTNKRNSNDTDEPADVRAARQAKGASSAIVEGADPSVPVNEGDVNPDGSVTGTLGHQTQPIGVSQPTPVKTREDVWRERRAGLEKIPFAELPVAKEGETPTFVKPASLAAGELDEEGNLPIGSQVFQTRNASTRRTSGATRKGEEELMRGHTRFVFGYVFEVNGNRRLPLADVIVTDYVGKNHTYTDANGRFEFDAWAWDSDKTPSDALDGDPKNDQVLLLAEQDGYLPASYVRPPKSMTGRVQGPPEYFFDSDLNSEQGALISLRWVGSDNVKVRITNPPADASTIKVRALSNHGDFAPRSDDNLLLEAFANAKGEVEFQIPPRRQLTITAQGPGYSSASIAVWNSKDEVWELVLESKQTVWIEGQVIDLRTNKPIPLVELQWVSNTVEYIFTDDEGKFGSWAAPATNGERLAVNITISKDGYARVSFEAYNPQPGRIKLLGSSTPEGPWEISLRPMVKLDGQIQTSTGEPIHPDAVASYIENGQSRQIPIYSVELAGGGFQGTMVPWGIDGLKFMQESIDPSGNLRTMGFHIEFPPSFWTNSNEYKSIFTAERR